MVVFSFCGCQHLIKLFLSVHALSFYSGIGENILDAKTTAPIGESLTVGFRDKTKPLPLLLVYF